MGDSLLDHCFEACEFGFRFKLKKKYDEWMRTNRAPSGIPDNTSSNIQSPEDSPRSSALENIPIIVNNVSNFEPPSENGATQIFVSRNDFVVFVLQHI